MNKTELLSSSWKRPMTPNRTFLRTSNSFYSFFKTIFNDCFLPWVKIVVASTVYQGLSNRIVARTRRWRAQSLPNSCLFVLYVPGSRNLVWAIFRYGFYIIKVDSHISVTDGSVPRCQVIQVVPRLYHTRVIHITHFN